MWAGKHGQPIVFTNPPFHFLLPGATLCQKKILVIDDEPKIVEICQDYLKASGFEVVSACDGLQGLNAAAAKSPI